MHMFIYSKCFAGSSRKNVYTLPYAFIYQKSVYITIHTKPLCTAHFPAAGSNVHTHAYAFYFKKVHTLPYIPICRQQSGKEDKTQFCGQVEACKATAWFAGRPMVATTLRGAVAAPLHCFCFSTTYTVHTICRPYTPLPRPGSACRPHSPAVALTKTKKRCKNTGNTRCIKKKNMKKEIKMDKYRKKNQKNKRK